MSHISFNQYYTLKPDNGKTLVLSAFPGRNMVNGVEDSFTNIIHPIYAMILSFIDGRDYSDCISEASTELDVPEELIKNFVDMLLDRSTTTMIKNQMGISVFPPYTIVTTNDTRVEKRYSKDFFFFDEVDLRMSRHMSPSTITFMLNNICVTDCVYCYQDKSRKVSCSIPLDRILELIREARSLNVNSIDVIGGEYFLYPYWREVLSELRKYNYNPYLSTKIPLKEDDIKFLSSLNVLDIQISLDTLIEEHLIPSLKVKKGYTLELMHSLNLLDRYNIPIRIHSVLTKYNDTIEDMASVFSFIRKIKNIKSWHIVKGDPSLYPRAPYSEIEIQPQHLNRIIDYLESIDKQGYLQIKYPERVVDDDTDKNDGALIITDEENNNLKKKLDKFFQRSFCSGLFSSLYILPDGNVTMCEQLYWNNDFIVGNVMSQSIEEIWNSDKAKSLFFIKQTDIPEDSKCHTCNYFNQCRNLRQICYREVIRKYGTTKWYYPDPNCPFNQEIETTKQ